MFFPRDARWHPGGGVRKRPSPLCTLDPRKTFREGGGVRKPPPRKSFVGKYNSTQSHMYTALTAKRSRWVYEGGELEFRSKIAEYFSGVFGRRDGSPPFCRSVTACDPYSFRRQTHWSQTCCNAPSARAVKHCTIPACPLSSPVRCQ
jgi:hypothetical protein